VALVVGDVGTAADVADEPAGREPDVGVRAGTVDTAVGVEGAPPHPESSRVPTTTLRIGAVRRRGGTGASSPAHLYGR